MKQIFLLIIALLLISTSANAQVGINSDNSAPDASAGLDVKFNNKGFLPPRMTFEQRNDISNPVEGLMVYCTNCNQDGTGTITIFQSGKWINIVGSCIVPASPPASSHIPSATEMIWKWNKVPIATGYKWNTTDDYATAINMGTDTSKTETELTCWTTYNRYVWAYNACGKSAACVLSKTTSPIPFSTAPTEGVHVPGPMTVVWNWNPVAGATGYKWNTINDFSSATDMATATTKTETGLTCGSGYSRFVWAYNGCGYSNPVSLSQSTVACLNCGTSVTINHLEGGVAPVTKTVTYGIVTNIPGLTYVCWISQNLGASQQATTVSDATEASAGWYWQFNRKQGYKHDGTARTPNTTWINSINETSDWIAPNDPCTIELGSGWRIPTITEWTNVDAIGNWYDWNGPWNSALKMHAAGSLAASSGSLTNRGSSGYSSSSTLNDSNNGRVLAFGSSFSYIFNASKAYGFPVRCLRDN
jgi:hypothetical protein